MNRIIKRTFTSIVIATILLTLSACAKTANTSSSQNDAVTEFVSVADKTYSSESAVEESSMVDISITVNDSVFLAKLYNNDTTKALLAQFPMTLDMSDLNGNEKYYSLAENLPSKSTVKPATINAGDIMCWSGNSLVIFYKTFSNSYGDYVILGNIEDSESLATAFGNGNVQVAFEVID